MWNDTVQIANQDKILRYFGLHFIMHTPEICTTFYIYEHGFHIHAFICTVNVIYGFEAVNFDHKAHDFEKKIDLDIQKENKFQFSDFDSIRIQRRVDQKSR